MTIFINKMYILKFFQKLSKQTLTHNFRKIILEIKLNLIVIRFLLFFYVI